MQLLIPRAKKLSDTAKKEKDAEELYILHIVNSGVTPLGEKIRDKNAYLTECLYQLNGKYQ